MVSQQPVPGKKKLLDQAGPPGKPEKRRSRWESSLAALRYIDASTGEGKVKLRDSDRATAIALLIVCIAVFLSLMLSSLAPHRLPLVVSSDVLVGAVLFMFVSNRMGIITSLSPRQAALTWQLMLGAGLIGIFLAINLAIISTTIVATNRITIPPGLPDSAAQRRQ